MTEYEKSPWFYKDEPINFAPPEYLGFVYKITNLETGRIYVGKKQLTMPKYRQVDGKKKKYVGESKWREYWSSSLELQNDVKLHGKEKFKREILTYCKTKGGLSYYEVKHQILQNVFEVDSYNGLMSIKFHRKHLNKEMVSDNE